LVGLGLGYEARLGVFALLTLLRITATARRKP
jgi:hypothetical protein